MFKLVHLILEKKNKANLRFTLKQPVNNLRLSYRIQNLTTGVYQVGLADPTQSQVSSTNLNGKAKKEYFIHDVGSLNAGYHASADLTYGLQNGSQGDNIYRMTATFFDGNTKIGSVSKDFVGKVVANKEDDLQSIKLQSQVDKNDGKVIGAVVKNDTLYRPFIGAIGILNPETKLENADISKARSKLFVTDSHELSSVSHDSLVRYTILNDNYRLSSVSPSTLPKLNELKDETTQKPLSFAGLNQDLSKKDSLGYTIATFGTGNIGVGGLANTVGTFSYVGNDKTARTDKVPIRVELLKVIDGKETVLDSMTVTKDVEIVNYDESLRSFFAEDFQIDRRASVGLVTKNGDSYSVNQGRYGTVLEHVRTWKFEKWDDGENNAVELYRLSEVEPNKYVFLENMTSLNIKKPTNAVFSDVNYTVHMDAFKRNDGQPLNFNEITMKSWVNRNPILTPKEYKETVYWLDESDVRHEVGSKLSVAGENFETRYSLPTNAKSIEIDIVGKVPIDYAPSYLVQYITDDSFAKVKADGRYLNSTEAITFDSRAYSVTSSLIDHLLNKKRDFTNYTLIKNQDVIDVQNLATVQGIDRNNAPLNQPFRVTADFVAMASSNGQLTANNLLNTTNDLEDNCAKQLLLLEDGLKIAESGWEKQSTFDFAGKTYNFYTRPWTSGKNINDADFATNILISTSANNLISNKQYKLFTGLVFTLKPGSAVKDGYNEGAPQLVYDQVERMSLDKKLLSLLGEPTTNAGKDSVRLVGRNVDISTKRSLEFTVNQTVEDSNIVTRDYDKSAGKQVDIAVTLSNGAQTASSTLEVIQKLPVGDLSYTFVAPKENSDYTVFYTSDSDVSSVSNWVSSKPSNVTGLKWVRKSALNTGTIDKVAYSIQVSNDKSRVTKSVASATMTNGNLVGTINDVTVRNNQEYRKLTIIQQTYSATGTLIDNATIDTLSLPVGEIVKYRGTVSDFYLNSVLSGSATQTSPDYTLPKTTTNWAEDTFVVPNRDTTMVFRFTQPADPTETRRTYTTTWENGYIEPDIQKLQTLFGNVRSYEFLPNESTQAVKKFNLIYTSGQKGVGYVDIKIEPKREKVVGIHKGITYQGDESKDLGYKETISGVNPSYDKVTNYPVDSIGTFSEVISKENEVAAKDATVILGTKPTVKTESTPKSTTYIADPDQTVKGKETLVSEGTDGSVKTTTTYTVNPTTGDITSADSVETIEKVDTVIKVGNKEVTTEPITMEVVYEADTNLEKDVQEVDVEGNAGVREITTTYIVSPTDGTLSNPQRTDKVTTPMVTRKVRVGSVHRGVVETEITTKYISDDTKVRDSKEDVSEGSKGIQTTTTTYQVDRNTGATHSPTTQVDNQPMVQKVVKVGTKPTVDVEPIAITTKYIFDPKLDYGTRIVEEKGSEGRVVTTTTYTMNESDGTTTANEPEVTTVTMKQRVIRVGVKPTVDETPLDFSTFYEPDPEAEKDSRVDKVVGKPGKVTTTTTYTYDETIGVVTPNPSTSQTEQPTDRIVKVGARPNVVETPIDFTTTYEADPESPRDTKTDKVVGKKGTTTVTTTYSVDPKTGVLTENPSVTTTKDPVNAIIKVGTKSTETVEVLPSPKKFVKDPTRPKDEEPMTEEGKTGTKTTVTTYTVDPNTGITTPNVQPPMVVEPTETIVKVPAKDKVDVVPIVLVTRYERDNDLEVGKSYTSNQGKEGSITTTTTYDVNPTTGEVTESGKTTDTDNMVEKVVKVGTKPKVEVETKPINVRYVAKEDVDYGTRNTKYEGSSTVVTTTTNYTLNADGTTTANEPEVTTTKGEDKVIEVGVKTSSVTVELPFDVETKYDSSLEAGQTVVDQGGEVGSKTITTTYTLNESTGEVTSNTTETSVQPKSKKVRIGTGVRSTNVRHVEHEVQFETETIVDPLLAKGTEVVVNEGALGKDIETIVEQLFNGEVKSSESSTKRVLDPVKRIVKVGTYEFDKPNDAPVLDKDVKELTPNLRETVFEADPTLTRGETYVSVEGSDGYTVTSTSYTRGEDGNIVTTLNEPEVVKPVNRIIKVGTKPTTDITTQNYTTTYTPREDKEVGYREVATKGVEGTTTVTTTYVVDAHTGDITAQGDTPSVVAPITEVIEVGVKPKVDVVPIKRTVKYIPDLTLEFGKSETDDEGSDGSTTTTTTYKVTETGEVVANPSTSETVEPKEQVVRVGTKPNVDVKVVARKVIYSADATKDFGYREVQSEGSDGSITTTTNYVVNKDGSVSPTTPTEDVVESVAKIVVLGTKPKVTIETTDYTTTYEADDSLPKGETKVKTKGKVGIKTTTVTYSIDSEMGIVREDKPTVTETEMVDEVIVVGTKSEVTSEPIPYEKEFTPNDQVEKGQTSIKTKGEEGKTITTVTYTVDKTTGKVTEKDRKVDIVKPKTEVVEVGTKPTTDVVVIPSVVKYVPDTTKEVGSDSETVKGKDGSKSTTTTYVVNPKTGDITEVVGIPTIVDQVETIVKVGAKSKEETSEIPIKTTYIDTPDLYVGEEKEIDKGKVGSVTKTTSYTVNEKTGEVTANKPWTTTVPMKNRVVHRGISQYKASVVANYYLEGTTEKLQESKEQKDLVVGSTYKTSSELNKAPEVTKEVKDGKETTTTISYELVSTPENAEGVVAKDGVVVNYYYKRVIKTEVKDLTPSTPEKPEKPSTPEKPNTPETPQNPEAPQKPQEAPKPTEKPVVVETPQKEEKPLREETKASTRALPNTGTQEAQGLGLLSGLGIFSAFGLLTRRKSTDED